MLYDVVVKAPLSSCMSTDRSLAEHHKMPDLDITAIPLSY